MIVNAPVVTAAREAAGSGREPINLFAAILTFGVAALVELSDPDRCFSCKGKGYET
jgi:hypothetical protein